MTTQTRTAWQLARLAECMDPDAPDSPGAKFLDRVESDYLDSVNDESYDEDDGPHEIADGAVPVYTHERWQVFVDLGAYQEDVTELSASDADLTECAGIALYMIAERLVRALHDEENDA